MKKIFLSLAVAVAAMALPHFARAEQINNLDVNLTVNKDASIFVEERIDYDFGQEMRHGIYRDIPYKYERNGLKYNLRISDVKVTDGQGQDYHVEQSYSGGKLNLKIGDAEKTVSGAHTYVIDYTVRRAVNYFDDHDELYWNAVGAEWTVPIQQAEAHITLPAGVPTSDITANCFAGEPGVTGACNSSAVTNQTVDFFQSFLASGSGLTTVVLWPKGFVAQPTAWQNFMETVRDNFVLAFPLVALIAIWYVWRRFGKDPRSKLPIAAQYEAPDGLTPVELGYLVDEKTQSRDLTAEIIFLATQGQLRIERIPKTGLFSKDDYKLVRLKHDAIANSFDQNLINTIFKTGDEVLLSKLKKTHMTRAEFKLNGIGQTLTQAGYYEKNPAEVRVTWMTAAGIGMFLVIFFGNHYAHSWIPPVSGIAAFAVIMVFSYFMPKKTTKGADTRQLALGLKEYIAVAEKDRLDFHNDPAKDPKIFEKLLPYAIAFGVSEQWAKKFEGLFDYRPTWYSDPGMTAFNVMYFHTSVNGFSANFQSMVAAQTAGRGASGSGGFSGGGFGGGGGGSW
jgi:hypothetical protein